MLGLVSRIVSSNLGKLFMMDIGINWGAFVVANHFQTDKFYDLTGKLDYTNINQFDMNLKINHITTLHILKRVKMPNLVPFG